MDISPNIEGEDVYNIPHAEYLKFCGYTHEDVDKMWDQFYDQEVVEKTFRNETDANGQSGYSPISQNHSQRHFPCF